MVLEPFKRDLLEEIYLAWGSINDSELKSFVCHHSSITLVAAVAGSSVLQKRIWCPGEEDPWRFTWTVRLKNSSEPFA